MARYGEIHLRSRAYGTRYAELGADSRRPLFNPRQTPVIRAARLKRGGAYAATVITDDQPKALARKHEDNFDNRTVRMVKRIREGFADNPV
jgi:hypothetical protein